MNRVVDIKKTDHISNEENLCLNKNNVIIKFLNRLID